VLSSATTYLWKSFRRSRTQFRDRPETVRLHPGTGVHLHPGILFEIIPEHRSESSRNRVHLAPDSPKTSHEEVPSWLDSENRHDRIVGSVLEIQCATPAAVVVLVTDDLNLQNKAEMAFIPWAEPPAAASQTP